MTVIVSITGTIEGRTRSEVASLIETKTNATFSKSVTYSTNYLVAARFDSGKAKKAAEIGESVISPSEMFEFVDSGWFPENETPEKPAPSIGDFSIEWQEYTADEQSVVLLDYADADGVVTEQRIVRLYGFGSGSNGKRYIGAYQGRTFKTFREDRVIDIRPA